EYWHDPVFGIHRYLVYPFTRESIPISTTYFGHSYVFNLPWHYFGIMSLITFPIVLTTLLTGLFYLGFMDYKIIIPILFCIGFWLILGHLPIVPKHNGVRQFISIYPLLGLISWAGTIALTAKISRILPCRQSVAQKVTLLFVSGLLLFGIYKTHPFELSYYNQFIGGVKGAEKSGMQLTMYFEAINHKVIAAMNRNIQPGQSLYMSPPWPPLLQLYKNNGQLEKKIKILLQITDKMPDYLLVSRRRFSVNEELYLSLKPIYEVIYNGVSLVKFLKLEKTNAQSP
ncbi:MAG: hypothetical protein JRI91_16560, partial [Deltaproteobacteria bacterium]|nr:hypothetical protein [Deltaproteobacteria bacterium]